MPADYLPLLVFPEKKVLQPEKGKGFPPGGQKVPAGVPPFSGHLCLTI